MGITNFSAINANLGPSRRNNDDDKYIFTRFRGPSHANLFAAPAATPDISAGGAAPGVAIGDINTVVGPGWAFQYYVNGAFAGQVPQVVSGVSGLILSMDAVDNDGIEFAPLLGVSDEVAAGVISGAFVTPSRDVEKFESRTDACFVRAKVKIEDVSALDFIALGFRKSEVPVAALATYTDYFVVNVNNGTLETRDRLNSGTESVQVSTETVADAGTVTLEVRVNSAGVARGYVDGAVIKTEIAGFTFDSGDDLIPFLLCQQDGTDGGGVTVQLWESGLFAHRDLADNNDLTN